MAVKVGSPSTIIHDRQRRVLWITSSKLSSQRLEPPPRAAMFHAAVKNKEQLLDFARTSPKSKVRMIRVLPQFAADRRALRKIHRRQSSWYRCSGRAC